MSRIQDLLVNYRNYIALPWRQSAADQRTIFCVYEPEDEMQIRYHMGEFEIDTKQAGHEWIEFDMTNIFEKWLGTQKYAKGYFRTPENLTQMPASFTKDIKDKFAAAITNANENTVIAIYGIASVYGFVMINDFIRDLSEMTKSRLVVFFPGSYSKSPQPNYKFLNAYDGWDYLATSITSDKNHF